MIAALKADTKTSLTLTRPDDTTLGTPLAQGALNRLQDVAVARSGPIVYAFATGNTSEIAVLDTPQAAPRVLTRSGSNNSPAISDWRRPR